MFAAAAALLTSSDGRVLLVKPNYRDHWSLPGGILEHGEPPHEGCRREVEEDLCPVTDDELRREFERAYFSGEMDQEEFRSVTAALDAKRAGGPRPPRSGPGAKPGPPEPESGQ